MSSDPKFRKRVRREIALRIREMRDGCLDCRAVRGLCPRHAQEAEKLILSPRKYLNLKETPANCPDERIPRCPSCQGNQPARRLPDGRLVCRDCWEDWYDHLRRVSDHD
jgi:hypothetical protein